MKRSIPLSLRESQWKLNQNIRISQKREGQKKYHQQKEKTKKDWTVRIPVKDLSKKVQ